MAKGGQKGDVAETFDLINDPNHRPIFFSASLFFLHVVVFPLLFFYSFSSSPPPIVILNFLWPFICSLFTSPNLLSPSLRVSFGETLVSPISPSSPYFRKVIFTGGKN